MQTLAIEAENEQAFERIRWMLEHFQNEGVRIVEEEDFQDLQIIREARKERDAMPLRKFLRTVDV